MNAAVRDLTGGVGATVRWACTRIQRRTRLAGLINEYRQTA